jgi:UDP-glucose 4-epimerase
MKYLVTGGSGFIGSHLVDRLLLEGHEVTVLDRSIKYQNIDHNLKNPSLHLYHEALEDNISDLFKDIDVVFHLAALTRPQWSITHIEETSIANIMGTIKVLDYCVQNEVKRVVFMSSSNLYGDQDVYPTPEDTIPNPMNAYALSKFVGEELCKLYQKLHGLEWNACRPFNAYGTRMPITGIYTSAVATFIDVIRNNKPLEMFGTGDQRRDFIYIDDIIDQLYRMAHSVVTGETFNCGSGVNTSINEVLELICKIMGKKVEPKRLPQQYEPKATLADIDKPAKLLGWLPEVSIQEGLRRTING